MNEYKPKIYEDSEVLARIEHHELRHEQDKPDFKTAKFSEIYRYYKDQGYSEISARNMAYFSIRLG